MQRSILPPVDAGTYVDFATEPQYTTSKQPVGGWIYLDSMDVPYGNDRSNCQIGSNSILITSANRIRILGFTTLWYIPNVNPRNNTITFWSSVTASNHTVQLVERYYNIDDPTDVLSLVTAIITTLNTVSGASGLNFSSIPKVGFPRTYDIVAAGGQFYFINTCSAVAKGAQMYGFQTEGNLPVPATTKQLGPMNMMYTQFVDIKSSTLTKWEKIRSVTTGNQNPVILRAYVGGNKWGLDFYALTSYLAFAWKYNEPIYAIDIQMFDQNGDPLYVPNEGKDFMWQLTLGAEL